MSSRPREGASRVSVPTFSSRAAFEEDDCPTLLFSRDLCAVLQSNGAGEEAVTVAAPAHYPALRREQRREQRHEPRRAPGPTLSRAPLLDEVAAAQAAASGDDATRIDAEEPRCVPSFEDGAEASLTLVTAAPEVMSALPTNAPEVDTKSQPAEPRRLDVVATSPRKLLPTLLIVVAALIGALLGRLCVALGDEERSTPSDTVPLNPSTALAFASPAAAALPPAAPQARAHVEAAHATPGEAEAAEAWLLGRRDRARALYEELVRRRPDARAFSLVYGHLAALASTPAGTLRAASTVVGHAAARAPEPIELAVLVRTRGRARVPVLLEGEHVGDTGEAGVLHLAVRAQEGASLSLELDEPSRAGAPAVRRTLRTQRDQPVHSVEVDFEPPSSGSETPRKRPLARHAPRRVD